MTPQETEPVLSVSVQKSRAEAGVNRGLTWDQGDWPLASPSISPFEGLIT